MNKYIFHISLSAVIGFVLGLVVKSSILVPIPSQKASKGGNFESSNRRPPTGAVTSGRSVGSLSESDPYPPPIQLLEMLAENDQLITNYFSLPIFDSDLSLNMNFSEALGLEIEQGKKLEKNVRSLFEDIRGIERKNAQILLNEDNRVLLNVPAFDPEVSKGILKKFNAIFSEILPENLANVMSSQFTKQNEDISSAILGRDRLLQIVPASDDGNEFSAPSKYTIKTVIRDKGTGVQYLKENGMDAFSNLSGWEQSFEKLPEQWKHLFETD